MAHIPLKARESTKELRRAVSRSKDEGQKTRIRAIISIKEGVKRQEVAKRFVISPTTLIYWIVTYNQGGIPALKMSKGGRPEGNPVWDSKVFKELSEEIDKGGYWSIPRMQDWLSQNHKVDIPEQTVWYRMDKLGYSYKGARPHPAKGDKEKQEDFKKGALLRSWGR